jgi:hypothetical protein
MIPAETGEAPKFGKRIVEDEKIRSAGRRPETVVPGF